jgi:hypothetical protein
MPGAAVASDRVQFGTTSVQLRECPSCVLAARWAGNDLNVVSD